jgi:hypothetical protein
MLTLSFYDHLYVVIQVIGAKKSIYISEHSSEYTKENHKKTQCNFWTQLIETLQNKFFLLESFM